MNIFSPDRFCAALRATINQKCRDMELAANPAPQLPFLRSEISVLEAIITAVTAGVSHEEPVQFGGRKDLNLTAGDRSRLRTAIDDVQDDGARLLLHRLINSTDDQRVGAGHIRAAGSDARGNGRCSKCGGCLCQACMTMPCRTVGAVAEANAPRTDRFTREENEREAVRKVALAAARETLSAVGVHGKDWESEAHHLAQTILSIFGEEK